MQIQPLDYFITIAYILGVVALGLYAGVLMKKKASAGEGRDYFLAGGTLTWPVIGMALFATNISCVHLVSLAQAGYDEGLLQGNFEWMAAFTLILLGLFFAPFYIRARVATLPDFLEQRYNRNCRDWLAVLSLVGAISIHVGMSFLTGGLVIEEVFGINFYTGIVTIALLTAIYTIVGGLLAVVLTEAIQTVILIIGACTITWFALEKMGGWSEMTTTLTEHGELNRLSMLRPTGDESHMPWYSIMLGYPVIGIWYWCADQTIVQRVLGAKDENHARVGPLFAACIKILPVFIFVLPGLLAYTLASKGLFDISSLPVDSDGDVDTKNIYTLMITQLLPTGLVGLMIAAILAALMSTVSGALNSISTLVSFDLYKRFRPQATDHQLVTVGRIAAAVALAIALGLVPVLRTSDSIFRTLNEIIVHIAPPITCVFLLGVFWKGATAFSAQWTLWVGSAMCVAMILVKKYATLPLDLNNDFMLLSFVLFCSCVMLQVVLAKAGPKVGTAGENVDLTWNSPLEPLRAPGWSGILNYKLITLGILLTMAVLYSVFR